MTVEITNSEVETMINERLRSGGFKDAEAVILDALQSSRKPAEPADVTGMTIEELFAPLKGLNLDFDSDR